MSNPKNQRANDLNPNNKGYKSAQDNRSNQLNPNNSSSKGAEVVTAWELDAEVIFADNFNGRD